ncbi:MAG TPA: hypothetical protein VGP93_04670 [Polyangiaceae bacterium]|nr:hypothetical protein [Polyangiaceae bacterium]
MYQIDDRDRVRELDGIPQSSVGAPIPIVLADEHRVVLAYYLQDTPPGWDGSTARMVDPNDSDEPIAIVAFERCAAHLFGPPNDEAFSGHPLAARGLKPYAAFEVLESSWLRRLERMNSVHPAHDPKSFLETKRHLVFAFHDSTFECICRGFHIQFAQGSVRSVLPRMVDLLG